MAARWGSIGFVRLRLILFNDLGINMVRIRESLLNNQFDYLIDLRLKSFQGFFLGLSVRSSIKILFWQAHNLMHFFLSRMG